MTVSQYIPSEAEVVLTGGKVRLEQTIHMKNYGEQVLFDDQAGGRVSRWSLRFTVRSETEEAWTLRLRIPGWCAGEPAVSLNGEPITPEKRDGYLEIRRVWGAEDQLDVFFPSRIVFVPLDGAEELVCAVDGPIVLAGLTEHDAGLRGDFSHPENLLLPDQAHTYGAFVWTQNEYLTRGQDINFRMVPLYEVQDEPYTVYFTRKP